MPTTYASSSDGLFLQSVTEQKHQGGLFTVSAEYRRISGNDAVPDTIPSSEGDITVYPEPTISIGTDGFETVNATGYGIWVDAIAKKMSLEVGLLQVTVYGWKLDPDPVDPSAPPYYLPNIFQFRSPGFIFETSHQTQMRLFGNDNIPSIPTLRLLNFEGLEVTEFQSGSAPGAPPASIIVYKTMKNIQLTSFGKVEQIEVVHAIVGAEVTLIVPDPNV
jgi:hypothetical protein